MLRWVFGRCQRHRHALAIRARAEMRLAEEYDAAQERGEVQGHGGEKSNVGNHNVATAADVCLRRDEIHEARKLRDAERDHPGFINRAYGLGCLGLIDLRAFRVGWIRNMANAPQIVMGDQRNSDWTRCKRFNVRSFPAELLLVVACSHTDPPTTT